MPAPPKLGLVERENRIRTDEMWLNEYITRIEKLTDQELLWEMCGRMPHHSAWKRLGKNLHASSEKTEALSKRFTALGIRQKAVGKAAS